MAQLTEVTLFKRCVENPITLDNLTSLNLGQFGSDAYNQSIQEGETMSPLQRNAQRLLHQFWSGLTKYIKQVCVVMNKPCELPGVGVFVPTNQFLKKALLTSDALHQLDQRDLSEIVMVLNRQFLEETALTLPSVKVSANGNLNFATTIAADSDEAMDLMSHDRPNRINYASISKVCQTSSETIQLLFREILAQLDEAIRKGQSVRLQFRIGRLDIKNGEISWKQFMDESNEAFKSFDRAGIQNSRYSKMRDHSRVSSFVKNNNERMTVLTPSQVKSRTHSQVMSYGRSNKLSNTMTSFNMSNPNPQPGDLRYKGVNQVGYKKYYDHTEPGVDLVKFGKKVDYGVKMSSEELMQEHLNQIREKLSHNRSSHVNKRQQEKDFLEQLAQLDKIENERKNFNKQVMQEDFKIQNEILKDSTNQKKVFTKENDRKMYSFFPFIGSDQAEKNKADINSQLRNDLQSFLSYQKQARSQAKRSQLGSESGAPAFSEDESAKDEYQKNMNRVVKHLFDSSYVRPQDNFRVVQDSNPVKAAVLNGAQQRYEQELEWKRRIHSNNMALHRSRIAEDTKNFERELMAKHGKQKVFNEQIREQMALDDMRRSQEKMELRKPIKTSFGPEEGQDVVVAIQDKKAVQTNIMKDALIKQLEQKDGSAKKESHRKIVMENFDQAGSKAALQAQRNKDQELKFNASKHWQNEIAKVQMFRKQIPQGLDVISKLA